jgi:tRNA nucleotidyltransferase (CCA-adding enzyme)
LGLTSKAPAVQTKYKNFFTVWPEARQKIPHALLQELRITPEVPGYDEMISRLFLGVIDGNLETEEQLRAFLEPYSPPAPPPPVSIRRTRGSKKSGEKSKVPVEVAFDGDADDVLPLDDDEAPEEPIEDVEDEDEGDSEPPITLPPAAKKSAPAPKKSPAESQPNSPASKPTKPEAPAPKASPAVVKSAPSPALHVVAPAKQAKVHVMAKQPAKPSPPPAPSKVQASKPSPNHAPSHPHPVGKKALHMKPVPAKAAVAKHVPAKSVPSKPVPAKMVHGHVAKPAVKHTMPSKKTAVKAPVKVQKKSEPAKKSHPAKKPVPARKHK